MRSGLTSLAIAMLATTALGAAAQAQSSYPCANDLPNPYHQVQNWAQTPRPWGPANAISAKMGSDEPQAAANTLFKMVSVGPMGCC